MAYFGGSAYAMARDLGEGYILLNAGILKRMSLEELRQLSFEMNRLLTGIRSEQYPVDDISSLQIRNRKLSRLNTAVLMVKNQLASHR